MTAPPAEPMGVETFLAWAEREANHKGLEIHAGRVRRRAPLRVRDLRLRGAVLELLLAAEEGTRSEHVVLGPGSMVVPGEATALDPDLVVVPRRAVDWDACTVPEPVAIVELVRRGGGVGAWADRLRAYAELPSLRHLLVLDAWARHALHLRRTSPGLGGWRGQGLAGGGVSFDPVPAAVDLDRLWSERSSIPGPPAAER